MTDADTDASNESFDADNPTPIEAYWEDTTKDRGVQKAPRPATGKGRSRIRRIAAVRCGIAM